MWFQIQRFTAAQLTISVTRGAREARGGATKPQPPQNCGKDVEEELGEYLWPPVRPGSGSRRSAEAHAGGDRKVRCLPGIEPGTDRPGGREMGADSGNPTSKGRGQIWEPGFAAKSVSQPSLTTQKKLDRASMWGLLWVRSVRHLRKVWSLGIKEEIKTW